MIPAAAAQRLNVERMQPIRMGIKSQCGLSTMAHPGPSIRSAACQPDAPGGNINVSKKSINTKKFASQVAR